jgi:hypothetical protein
MSPQRERANVRSRARGALAKLDDPAASAGAPRAQARADVECGSPPLSFSPRRVGLHEDAGAQQQ